jgi:hypothetical protein
MRLHAAAGLVLGLAAGRLVGPEPGRLRKRSYAGQQQRCTSPTVSCLSRCQPNVFAALKLLLNAHPSLVIEGRFKPLCP